MEGRSVNERKPLPHLRRGGGTSRDRPGERSGAAAEARGTLASSSERARGGRDDEMWKRRRPFAWWTAAHTSGHECPTQPHTFSITDMWDHASCGALASVGRVRGSGVWGSGFLPLMAKRFSSTRGLVDRNRWTPLSGHGCSRLGAGRG
jgi:hypothetical protein